MNIFPAKHETELQHRINEGWAKFAVFRNELTDKHYELEHRMRLFHSTVQPTMLYGCGCWTMTKAREHQIRTTQRRMLRRVIGTKRWTKKSG